MPLDPSFEDSVVEIATVLPQWFTKTGIENLKLDIKHQKGFVLRDNENQVLGFVTYFMNQGVAQIGWMGVHPDQHRKSIGSQLLEALEESLSSYGIKELLVSTLGDSVDYEPYARTRSFYRKNGFVDYKKINHLENPECEEELVLRKDLNGP